MSPLDGDVKRDVVESDLNRVDALRDENIDYSDIPELDADFFREAHIVAPKEQRPPARAGDPARSRGPTTRTERLTR